MSLECDEKCDCVMINGLYLCLEHDKWQIEKEEENR